MSKPAAKGQVLPKQSPSTSRLDDTISDLTTKTVKGIKQYRIVFISLIGLVVVAGLAIYGFGEYQRIRERALVARAYRLFERFESASASAAPGVNGDRDTEADADSSGDDPATVLPKVRELVADARGADCERLILKDAVSFLLERAQQEPEQGNADDESAPTPSISPRYLDEVKELIERARSIYTDDEDFQNWADASERAVDSLFGVLNEEREKREFQPVLPPGTATESDDADAEGSHSAPTTEGASQAEPAEETAEPAPPADPDSASPDVPAPDSATSDPAPAEEKGS